MKLSKLMRRCAPSTACEHRGEDGIAVLQHVERIAAGHRRADQRGHVVGEIRVADAATGLRTCNVRGSCSNQRKPATHTVTIHGHRRQRRGRDVRGGVSGEAVTPRPMHSPCLWRLASHVVSPQTWTQSDWRGPCSS